MAEPIGKRRAQIVPQDWVLKQIDGEAVDLEGKNVYLFQLPVSIPVQCYKNVKLPSLKSNRSKTVTITDGSTDDRRTWKVKFIKTQLSPDFTLMDARKGKVRIGSVQPTKLIQGVIDDVDTEAEFEVPVRTKHVLPDGLRQRFTPYGVTVPQTSPKKSPRKRHAAERQVSVLMSEPDESPPSKKIKKSKNKSIYSE